MSVNAKMRLAPPPAPETLTDVYIIEEPPFVTTLNHAAADPFRLLVEAVKDYGIFMLDPAGNVSSWNPGAEKSKGYKAEEIIGQHLSCFYTAEDVAAGKPQRGLQTASTEGRFEEEGLRVRKDGTTFWAIVTITDIKDSFGQHVGFANVTRDITERKHLEDQFHQAQKMEAVGQLAGGVAHDFNNLLTVISGYSEILLATLPANDPKREAVKAISEAGERAAGLTRQLLFFSRQAMLEMKVLDLNEVVKDTEKMLRRMIGEDILLTAVLDPNISRIKGDHGQIGQILMNLAVNARDAMPTGGKLTIESSDVQLGEAYAAQHSACKPGRYVKMAVSDNGCGMTTEVKSHIFEPFFTTKEPGKGTGLGLATVYGIVKQSGGSIEVYSEPGIGTTFKIYLPAVDEPVQRSTNYQSVAKVTGGTETVLLVEDEDAVRAIALLALQTHGYTVLQAENGKRALAIIERHRGHIDLLVTDVVMPGSSGRELAENLTARFPGLKVLYLSGYTDDSVIRHGILEAEVDYLQKPFTPLGLARKVRQVLDK
jgi:two-component system cell cycle sensor histidine kinase/response regulator CckA